MSAMRRRSAVRRIALSVAVIVVVALVTLFVANNRAALATASYVLTNSIFASGTGGGTLRSGSYRMQGTLGEPGLPSNGTTLTSQNYRQQPGFLAAVPQSVPASTATPSGGSTPTPILVPTPTPQIPSGPTHIYLPIVQVPAPTPTPPLCNGNFADGGSGLACWTAGGTLLVAPGQPAVQVTTDPHDPGQGNTALLGSPGFACEGGVPDGDAYVAQTVTLPEASRITLTFWYDIWTQNVEYTSGNQVVDSFDVWVNLPNVADPSVNGTRVFRDGYQEQPGSGGSGCGHAPNEVQNTGQVDLTAYQGKTITLYFANYHRGITSYNTYTYLADVTITAQ